ncbi:MAG: AlpA family phage regulatory protein [Proteobacteria bacterium]|nr:AlpA family phage regulatory protein [Pseudomonadota bacterium]
MERLLRISDVVAVTGFERAWLYHLINRNKFPRQVKVGKRAVRWRESEVAEWIDSREVTK